MISFDDVYNAYEEAEFGQEYGARAYINAGEERVLFIPSEATASFEEIDNAERELESGGWVEFPDKYELHLGTELVSRFAAEHLSNEDYRQVQRFFSHRGAYGNWKDFLEDRNLLNQWYEFSENAKIEVLKNWLTEMEIPFEEKSAGKTT